MSDDALDPRAVLAALMIARLERDHAAVVFHRTILAATLDYVATMIVLLEPNAGAAESWVSTFVGALVAGTGVAAPFAGLAATLTLLTERGIDAGLLAWARARLAAKEDGA